MRVILSEGGIRSEHSRESGTAGRRKERSSTETRQGGRKTFRTKMEWREGRREALIDRRGQKGACLSSFAVTAVSDVYPDGPTLCGLTPLPFVVKRGILDFFPLSVERALFNLIEWPRISEGGKRRRGGRSLSRSFADLRKGDGRPQSLCPLLHLSSLLSICPSLTDVLDHCA